MTADPDVLEVWAYVEGRLDADYLQETAVAVAASLRGQGQPLGVAFQPGDGTRYDLAFLPLQNLRSGPGRVKDGETWSAVPDFGCSRVPGTALVTWYRNGAAGFDFRSGGFEPIYLQEVFRETGLASACAIALLFNAVADAFGSPRGV